jgi:hypothetical protein
MTPIDKFLDKVLRILAVVQPSGTPGWQSFRERFQELAQVMNPEFPQDTFNLLDIAKVASLYQDLPGAGEIAILSRCWDEAWGWSGELHWKYMHPKLTLQYTPKHTGAYYTVEFYPAGGAFPLGFPLIVTFTGYADMDKPENHADNCPVMHVMEHADTCPCKALLDSDECEFDEKKWEEAEAECCCAADDCDCEPGTWTASKKFDSPEGFAPKLTEWLSEMIRKE